MFLRTTLLMLGLSGACSPAPVEDTDVELDADEDGFTDDVDCNDADEAVNPDALEVCNGVDDDCNGTIDDNAADSSVFYADGDGDGVGRAGAQTRACSAPDGFAATAGDCDDNDEARFPGNPEVPDDNLDQDCSGRDTRTCFVDADMDGYGTTQTVLAPDGLCDRTQGESYRSTDCDDGNDAISPIGTEIPENEVDENCDSKDSVRCWSDVDRDGFGDPTKLQVRVDCTPTSVADNADDCDDTLARVNPLAAEVCDGLDTDCAVETLDAGTVSFEHGGVWTDVTATYATAEAQQDRVRRQVAYAAADHGTLRFCEGTWYTTLTVQSTDLELLGVGGPDLVVLSGADPATVGGDNPDGVRADQILKVAGSADLLVQGVTLTHGASPSTGGAVAVSGAATVDLVDVRIEQSTAAASGGGLSATHTATVTLTDSVVRDNEAPTGGGLSLAEDALLTCEIDTGAGGIYGNTGTEVDEATAGGASFFGGGGATARLVSLACDWGVATGGSPDNDPPDIHAGSLIQVDGSALAADADFECSALAGCTAFAR